MSIRITDKALLRTQAYIDGQWHDSDSGQTFEVRNPATGEVIASCASCGTAETRRAIEVADRALAGIHADQGRYLANKNTPYVSCRLIGGRVNPHQRYVQP